MIRPAKFLQTETLRFIVAGLFNTGLSYSIYAVGLVFGVDYRIANLIALIISILVAFFAGGHWVFKKPELERLPRFFLMWGGLWIVNVSMIGWFLPYLNNNAFLAGALTVLVIFPTSYFIQKYFVFGEKIAR
jgi:putative flippase GtrA